MLALSLALLVLGADPDAEFKKYPRPSTPSPPPIVPAQQTPAAASNKPECKMGNDGRQACGFHCLAGDDGHAACANTADGVCAMGNDGHVVCSQIGAAPAAAAPALVLPIPAVALPAAECK